MSVASADEKYEWEEVCGASSCSWYATYNNGQQVNTIMELNHSKCNILSDTEAECVVISEQTNWDSSKDTCPRYIHPYDKVKITLNPSGFSKEIIELGNIPDGCKYQVIKTSLKVGTFNVEIISFPNDSNGPMNSIQSPVSVKINDTKNNETTYFHQDLFTIAFINNYGERWPNLFNEIRNSQMLYEKDLPSIDLMEIHKLSNFEILVNYQSNDVFKKGFIDQCKVEEYENEGTYSEGDQCYYFGNAPITITDIDLDGENEIILLNKYEGAKMYDSIEVFEFNGDRSNFYKGSGNNFDYDMDDYKYWLNKVKL